MKNHFIIAAVMTAGSACAQAPASTIGIAAGYGRDRILSNDHYSSVSHSAYQAGLTADV